MMTLSLCYFHFLYLPIFVSKFQASSTSDTVETEAILIQVYFFREYTVGETLIYDKILLVTYYGS
jgi:hypothetical protein